MILSQKKIEEIAVAVIRDFQKSFFGSEADDPARFALPTPIDQFASDYLNLKVSFQKLSSDGSIYGLTAYVDTEYQIEVDGSQRSIFLKTSAKRFEERYLRKGFDEQISVIRILDSRREEFRLSKAYEQKIDVVNVITAPEIEMLIIHAEGAYDQFKRSGKKPSEFCKINLRMHDVKSYDFVKQYFSNPQLLVKAIKEYRRTANIPKGEYSLSDLLR